MGSTIFFFEGRPELIPLNERILSLGTWNNKTPHTLEHLLCECSLAHSLVSAYPKLLTPVFCCDFEIISCVCILYA